MRGRGVVKEDTYRNMPWARFVREVRKAKMLTRCRMAELVQIDPSYVTLIERDGFVPRRAVVIRIGMALGNVTDALVAAGLIPLEERSSVAEFFRTRAPERIPADIAKTVRDLAEAPSHIRQQAVAVLSAILKSPVKPTRKKEA